MLSKRDILKGGVAVSALALSGGAASAEIQIDRSKFPIQFTEAEWRERLTKIQYAILRKAKTERAYSSPLNDEKRKGVYLCAACDEPVFHSSKKFDSGTGWPSFSRPIRGGVGKAKDTSFFMTRTEVHCKNCGGHLGHVFEDGPTPPRYERYCINGAAMTFRPDTDA